MSIFFKNSFGIKKNIAVLFFVFTLFLSTNIQETRAGSTTCPPATSPGTDVCAVITAYQIGLTTTASSITAGSAPVTATASVTNAGTNIAALSWTAVGKNLLDYAAYSAGQKLLSQLTANTIKWIQGGFHGSPSFAVDWNEIATQVGDEVAGKLVLDVRNISICKFTALYKDNLKDAITMDEKLYPYTYKQQAKCPFTETAVGQTVSGVGIAKDTRITGLGTGRGGKGTYIINKAHTIPAGSSIIVGSNYSVVGEISGTTLTITSMMTETINLKASDFYNGLNTFTWDQFSSALEPGGNPYSLSVLTAEEKAARKATAMAVKTQKLSWSNGFTDIVDTNNCGYPADSLYAAGDIDPDVEEVPGVNNPNLYVSAARADQLNQQFVSDPSVKGTYCKTTTPGKIVGDQLTKSLGVDMDRLGFADNMNKIIAAFLDTLTQKAIRGVFGQGDSYTSVGVQSGYVHGGNSATSTGPVVVPPPGTIIGGVTTPGSNTPVATVATGVSIPGRITSEIHGTVLYLGYDPYVSVSFKWGTSTTTLSNLGQEVTPLPVQNYTPFHGVYSASTAQDFQATLTGLTPGRTYYYQATVQTSPYVISPTNNPTPTLGEVLSFTTLP